MLTILFDPTDLTLLQGSKNNTPFNFPDQLTVEGNKISLKYLRKIHLKIFRLNNILFKLGTIDNYLYEIQLPNLKTTLEEIEETIKLLPKPQNGNHLIVTQLLKRHWPLISSNLKNLTFKEKVWTWLVQHLFSNQQSHHQNWSVPGK